MPRLMLHPLVLRSLQALAMARAFARYRNPRRRAVGREHTAFYDRMWRDTAADIGAKWHSLGNGIGEIELGGAKTRVSENVTEIDDPVTLTVLHDKPLTHQLLQAQGLPVARHQIFSLQDVKPALRFLRSTDGDCVVKPANGTGGGRGVTTGIRTPWQLARAAAAAAVYGDELLIEQQIAGDNYRLLYLDGRLIDAYVRHLPSVIGDGRCTVKRLVDRLNADRAASGVGVSQVLLTIDLDMRRTLAKQGLSLRSVPARGRRVALKTVVNENSGTENSTATEMLCKSVIEEGARAVRALRVRFAGIDIITPDPARPLAEAGGVICEVNGTPNLYFHYRKRDGSFPVAMHLLRRLLPQPEVPPQRESPASASIRSASTAAV